MQDCLILAKEYLGTHCKIPSYPGQWARDGQEEISLYTSKFEAIHEVTLSSLGAWTPCLEVMLGSKRGCCVLISSS